MHLRKSNRVGAYKVHIRKRPTIFYQEGKRYWYFNFRKYLKTTTTGKTIQSGGDGAINKILGGNKREVCSTLPHHV